MPEELCMLGVKEASRPPDERWCTWCDSSGRHAPGCPLLGDVAAYLEGLAGLVLVDAAIEAMDKPRKEADGR